MNLARREPVGRVRRSRSSASTSTSTGAAACPTRSPQRCGALGGERLDLATISTRGTKVWPGGFPETLSGDHWSCRYLGKGAGTVDHKSIAGLLERVSAAGIDFIKTENLYDFDGKPGYSLAQGQ